MSGRLQAAIERFRKTSWVVTALLVSSIIVGLAQFTGASRQLIDLVRPTPVDPRAELAGLGIAFTPDAFAKAVAAGDSRATGLLLDAGMAVDAKSDANALPPLMLAAQEGQLAVAKRLLDAGADPAKSNAAGTPLAYAVRYDHPDLVSLFLGRPVPQPVIEDALLVAAEGAQASSITLLEEHITDKPGAAAKALRALIDHASGKPGELPTAKALLALRPDLDRVDQNGQTLLHLAVNNDATALLQLVLAAGAKREALGKCSTSDEAKATPLYCAAGRGTSTGLASVEALIAAHANVDARTPEGMTPLMLAASIGDADVSAALLKAGADPRLRDTHGQTALAFAQGTRFGQKEQTLALLKSHPHG